MTKRKKRAKKDPQKTKNKKNQKTGIKRGEMELAMTDLRPQQRTLRPLKSTTSEEYGGKTQ